MLGVGQGQTGILRTEGRNYTQLGVVCFLLFLSPYSTPLFVSFYSCVHICYFPFVYTLVSRFVPKEKRKKNEKREKKKKDETVKNNCA